MHPDKVEQLTIQYLSKIEKEWGTLNADQQESYAYSSSESSNNIPLTNIYGLFQPLNKSKVRQSDNADNISLSTSISTSNKPLELEAHPTSMHLSKILIKDHHLILLGEPGAGKTTVLQFIGLCFVRKGWAKDRLELEENRIPIRLLLRQHTDTLSSPGPGMEKALAVAVNKFLRLPNSEDAENLLNEWLNLKKPLLVLLDGLDEIPEKMRIQVAEEIRIFSNSYGANCRIILSSRPIDMIALGANFRSYIFRPFEHGEDALPYLEAWFKILEKNVRDAASLLETLNSQAGLKRITNNPLLLRLAAEVYQPGKPFIRNRSELYREYVEQIAWQRRGLAISPDEKRVALDTLELLAWQMQSGETTSIPENFTLLREQLGLVEPWQEDDKISLRFSHQTFQEYFVARRLKKDWTSKKSREKSLSILKSQLHDQKWREPLLLLIGMLDTNLAADLIYRVLNVHSRYEKELFRDLRLAAQLTGERTDLPKTLVKQIVQRLIKKLTSISLQRGNWWRRSSAEEALEKIGPQAIDTLIKINRGRLWLIRSKGINHPLLTFSMIYQIIIDYLPRLIWLNQLLDEVRNAISAPIEALSKSMQASTLSDLLPYIIHKDVAFRLLTINAVGRKGNDQAIPVLLQALEDRNENVRQASARALGEIGNLNAALGLRKLLGDPDEEVRRAVLVALADIGDSYMIDEWVQRVHEETSNFYPSQHPALVALGKIGAPAIPALAKIAEEYRGEGLGFAAMQILSEMFEIRAIPTILKVIYTPEWSDERREMFNNLIKIGSDAIPILLNALKDEDMMVRTAAISVLGKVGNEQIIPDLLKMLEDPERTVRRRVVEVLGNIGDIRVVPSLLKAMQATFAQTHDRGWEQAAIQESLLEIGIPAMPFLIHSLHSPIMEMRRLAVETLGKIRNPNAIPELLNAFEQSYLDEIDFQSQYVPSTRTTTPEDVRWAILEALGEIGDLSAVPFLRAKLLAQDRWGDFIRGQSAKALGKIGDIGSIPDLLQIALNTIDDNYVRGASINALGMIGDNQIVSSLIKLLNDSNSDIRTVTYKALGEIGDQRAFPELQKIAFDKILRLSDEERLKALFKTGGADIKILGKEWYEHDEWVVEYALKYLGALAIPGFLRARYASLFVELIWKNISIPDAIPALKKALQVPENSTRRLAAKILGEIGMPAIHALIEATKSEDVTVRIIAIEALTKIGDPQFAYAMHDLLFDPETDVKWLAAIGLGKLGLEKEQVISVLLNTQPEQRFAYHDEMKASIEVLGNLGDERVLPFLMGQLQHQDVFPPKKGLSTNRQEKVRSGILNLLSKIRSVFVNLRGPDSGLDEAMIKISGRVKKENANALKSIARFFYRQRDWGNLEIVVNRVEKLQPKNQKLTSNSLLQRWLPQFIRGVEWAIGTILLGLVLLLSNILGDLVKGQWLVSLQTWAMAHPWLLLFLTSGVILLSGVLALGLKAINQASDVQGEKK